MTHKEAGIRKKPSIPLYPADVLSDSALAGASIEERGAWLWLLMYILHEDTDRHVTSWESLRVKWGLGSTAECRAMCHRLEEQGICRVEMDETTVCLVNRRRERVLKERRATARRVAKCRAKSLQKMLHVTVCNKNVTRENPTLKQECNAPIMPVVGPDSAAVRVCNKNVTKPVTSEKCFSSSSSSLSSSRLRERPPIVPQENRVEFAQKKEAVPETQKPVGALIPVARRIARWFGRRDETKLNPVEVSLMIGLQERGMLDPESLEVMEKFRQARKIYTEKNVRAMSCESMLTNWCRQLDYAREHVKERERKLRT